ncbi:MAG: phosphodiester glycosidase family protein [Bacilli bacterium]
MKSKKLTITLIVLDICVFIGFFLTYGPFDYFRNLLITTSMTTMEHQYLAKIFYGPKTISKVLNSNYVVPNKEEIKLDDIILGSDISEKDSYSSIYEEQIFKRDEGNTTYKIIPINEYRYKGYLTVIYDPANVKLAVPSQLGRYGETVAKMCKNNGGLVGINGGGFEDLDGWGNGSIPYGAIIKEGKLIYTHPGGNGGLIGFNKEHKMYLTYETPAEAIKKGMRDAVEFGPFLIVNGKPAQISGDGGWGVAPRSVIAQRKDGIVLMLIIDGRNPGYSLGADLNDLIKLLLRYKAYNAANLDGGASTTMAVNGKLYNKPYAGGEYGGRTVSNAWIVTKGE